MPPAKRQKILIIDDEPAFFDWLFYSQQEEWEKVMAKSEEKALELLETHQKDLSIIILDLSLKNQNAYKEGLVFLEILLEKLSYSIPVFIISNDDDMKTYQAALDLGAAGFLHKGSYTPESCEIEIKAIVDKYVKGKPEPTNLLLTKSSALQALKESLFSRFQTGHTGQAILLHGPEGVGKLDWAVALATSKNSKTAYRAIALDKLTEDEISFPDWRMSQNATVAIQGDDPGILIFSGLETASLRLQTMILSLIEAGQTVILLSRENLQQKAASRNFLKELYAVLIPFRIMPLNERPEDIAYFADIFLANPRVCPRHKPFFGKKFLEILSKEDRLLFKGHSWTTNLRELRSTVQYVVGLKSRGVEQVVQAKCLPPTFNGSTYKDYPIPNGGSRQELSAELKLQAFEKELTKAFHSDLPIKQIIEDNLDELLAIRQLEPELVRGDDYPRTLKAISEMPELSSIKIDILVCYAWENLEMAKVFQKHLKSLERTLPLQTTFSTSQPIASAPGDMHGDNLRRNLDNAHFLIVLTCNDLITWPLFATLIYPKVSERASAENITALYLIGRRCNLNGYPGITATKYLPWKTPPVPISAHDDIDDVFVNIVQEIEKMLHRLPQVR